MKKFAPVKSAPSVQNFVYEGTNNQGKPIKGEIASENIARAKAELRKQGITPTRVKALSVGFFGKKKKKITSKEIAILSRQLATMMKAGVPLIQSFEIVGKGHENASVQALVHQIKISVESGNPFSEALKKFPLHFDALFCNLVASGEQSGTLDVMLDRIALYKEKTENIKGKIKKALFYPTAVVIVAIIVTLILLIYVVPQFEQLFKGFGADLPAFTKMVVSLSDWLRHHGHWLFLGTMIASGITTRAYKKSRAFVEKVERLSLALPIIGPILHKAAIARFARTLSITFAAGVPLTEALVSVAGASGNIVYQQAILGIRDDVTTGQTLQLSIRQTQLFPNMVVQMIAIGEESGSLDAMLAKVADFYEAEVDQAVDGLSSLLEPLIMAVLGVLVGGLVIAMYLPIFKMGSVV